MKGRIFYSYLLLLMTLLIIAACGTAPPARPTSTPSANFSESENDSYLRPATLVPLPATIEAVPATQPPAPLVNPEQPTHEPGYPPPAPTFPPTVDPYPGGLVWIIRPVGVQCEDGTTEGYGDLRESVATLTAAGLQVEGSEMLERVVPAVCGSPTSAHYRIQIKVEGLDTARAMGWERELN